MDAVTYPDQDVAHFLNENFAPVRLPIADRQIARQYRAAWTPTFLIFDTDGEEHQRSVGYLPPDQFIPMLLLGLAKIYFDKEDYDRARPYLDRILKDYRTSDYAAEALYYHGVSKYKQTHDSQALKEINEQMEEEFPGSEWAKRASVYSKL